MRRDSAHLNQLSDIANAKVWVWRVRNCSAPI
jgi:hypothetical protein